MICRITHRRFVDIEQADIRSGFSESQSNSAAYARARYQRYSAGQVDHISKCLVWRLIKCTQLSKYFQHKC